MIPTAVVDCTALSDINKSPFNEFGFVYRTPGVQNEVSLVSIFSRDIIQKKLP